MKESSCKDLSDHTPMMRQYLGHVVPYDDNFFAALNAAVASDGTLVYVPKNVRCPLVGLLEQQFLDPHAETVTAAQRNALALDIPAYRLVFVDGRFNAALSVSDLGDYHFDSAAYGTPQALSEPIQPEMFLHLTESLAQETHILPAGRHGRCICCISAAGAEPKVR